MPAYERVLVTGGSGRLGMFVVDELRPHHQVTVLDRQASAADVPFIKADIEDRAAMARAFEGIDAVVHLAALDQGVKASDEDFFRINVQGLWNVLEFAEQAGVKRVVATSSVVAANISRAHPPRYLPVDVEHPAAPVNAYGISKRAGEVVAEAFARRSAMEVISLRPSWVLRDECVHGLALAMARAESTPPPDVATIDPAWESRDEAPRGTCSFVSSRDAARAFRAAVTAEVDGYETCFVTAADTHSALPTSELMQREFDDLPEVRDPGLYSHDPRASAYDIAHTHRVLGWQPEERWADIQARVLGPDSGRVR